MRACCSPLWSAAAVFFFHSRGWLLYYGDAECHLDIARRMVDSQTPGYKQVGTVWLPLAHWPMLPFVRRDDLWHSGIAGAIPVALFFVLGGCFLFAAVRRIFRSRPAAIAATALCALNPNLLYIQATPMTEGMFFGCLTALLYFTVRFRETQAWWAVTGAGIAVCLGTLTRYDGWFLIPFVASISCGRPTAPLRRGVRLLPAGQPGTVVLAGAQLVARPAIRWISIAAPTRRSPFRARALTPAKATGGRRCNSTATRPTFAPVRAWRSWERWA